ncbi:MAG: hypothetical protein GXO61_01955 [Epsilonproteobacteria bacterium]|nr:hypothetical protein [Campylobacterota bacterium]
MGIKLLAPLLAISLVWGNYPDIDRLIEKVKVRRVGLSTKEIAQLKNPFISKKKLKKVIKVKKVKRTKKKRFRATLYSIFNNRAKINGRWRKIGDRIGPYRLVFINAKGGYVVLRQGRKELKLFLPRRTRKVNLISRGNS